MKLQLYCGGIPTGREIEASELVAALVLVHDRMMMEGAGLSCHCYLQAQIYGLDVKISFPARPMQHWERALPGILD